MAKMSRRTSRSLSTGSSSQQSLAMNRPSLSSLSSLVSLQTLYLSPALSLRASPLPALL